MDINDSFTIANTALCCLLIVLRLFYYRNNPKLDDLIRQLSLYLKDNLSQPNLNQPNLNQPNLRPDPNLRFPSNGDSVNNDNKSSI